MYTSPRTKRTVHLLAQADRCNRLAKQSVGPDRMAWYRRKDQALDLAIRQMPEEFVVDSIEEGERLVMGVTHAPSGRRAHLCPQRLSLRTQVILYRLAHRAGIEYSFLRLASEPIPIERLRELRGLAESLSWEL